LKPANDKAEIRRRLNQDRVWSLYALADLDDELFPDCDWFVEGEDALALVYRGIAIQPLFVLGPFEDVRALLQGLPADHGYLNLPFTHQAAADGLFEYDESYHMRRMLLDDFRPSPGSENAVPLTRADSAAIAALYATGEDGGVAYGEQQLDAGFFRGVWRDRRLDAVAGTHVVSRNEGVAGVGNIFVHPEHRGQGLAQAVTSAVVAALITAGIPSIGLNVELGNDAAYAVYKKLGFRTRLEYLEGPARRIPATQAGSAVPTPRP
jgi:ribosomal protein S18 acetylase RimI-like enzyme